MGSGVGDATVWGTGWSAPTGHPGMGRCDGQQNPGEASWQGRGHLYLSLPDAQQPLCSPHFQRSQRFQPGWPMGGATQPPWHQPQPYQQGCYGFPSDFLLQTQHRIATSGRGIPLLLFNNPTLLFASWSSAG